MLQPLQPRAGRALNLDIRQSLVPCLGADSGAARADVFPHGEHSHGHSDRDIAREKIRCLSRVAFLDGNGWLMLGKLCAVRKEGGHRSGCRHEDATCSLKPQQHLECDTFKNYQGLSRVACLDGNGWLMLGKLCAVRKEGGHRSGWRHKEVTCSLKPQQHLECDTFKNCQGLSHVAFLDGNGWLMLGKLCALELMSALFFL